VWHVRCTTIEPRKAVNMNIEKLQLINRNETTNTILKLWARSNPKSNETNVDSFKMYLFNKGYSINKDEYFRLFNQLEECGVGKFVDKSNFVWNHSLKEVSEQILSPNKIIIGKPEEKGIVMKKGRGRPKGSRNKPKEVKRRTVIKDVVFVFTNYKGEAVPINLIDADRLVKEITKIKEQFAG